MRAVRPASRPKDFLFMRAMVPGDLREPARALSTPAAVLRRVVSVALAAAAIPFVVAACSNDHTTVYPVAQTVEGSLPKAALPPATAAFKLKGDPAAGSKIFQ